MSHDGRQILNGETIEITKILLNYVIVIYIKVKLSISFIYFLFKFYRIKLFGNTINEIFRQANIYRRF